MKAPPWMFKTVCCVSVRDYSLCYMECGVAYGRDMRLVLMEEREGRCRLLLGLGIACRGLLRGIPC